LSLWLLRVVLIQQQQQQQHTQVIIDASLDANFQYSKSTELFHNFQDGSRIWGFNFASEDEARMLLGLLDAAREEIKSMCCVGSTRTLHSQRLLIHH
jgi:hypothetical protein